MRRYIIYCHTNRVNAKRYVGWAIVKTGQTPHDAMIRRWNEHCRSRRSDLFPRAIRKHGETTWDHEVIEIMTTLKSTKHAEKLWIAERKTYALDLDGHGYNMTRGGDGCPWPKGLKKSSETRRKISESLKGKPPSNKGKKASETARRNLSIAHKGRVTSVETRRKQSEALKGRQFSDEHRKHVSEALKGHSISNETREKIRQTLKSRNASKEMKNE